MAPTTHRPGVARVPTLEDLALRLREFLHAHDLSQHEAARRLGVKQATLSRLLSGHDLRYSIGAHLLHAMNEHDSSRARPTLDSPVKDVMSRVHGVSPASTLRAASRLLARSDYSFAPLAIGRRKYGALVSRRKLADALEKGADPEMRVGEALEIVTEGEPAYVASRDRVERLIPLLQAHRVVLVRSSSGNVSGIVTPANLSLLAPESELHRRASASNARRGL